MKKLQEAPVKSTQLIADGYLLKLKEAPINDQIEEDIVLQNRVNKYFGL